jgi:aryl-alcohol dehydrogenase-like predicted oxidoreductase
MEKLNMERVLKTLTYSLGNGKLEIIAARHKANPAQITLAWLLHRSPNIIVIPGAKSINHLLENIAAARINLSEWDFQELSG